LNEQIDLSHGLYFTGGEPFLNFDLLVQTVEIAEKSGIPSTLWKLTDIGQKMKISPEKN
jgi:hypothetical protein